MPVGLSKMALVFCKEATQTKRETQKSTVRIGAECPGRRWPDLLEGGDNLFHVHQLAVVRIERKVNLHPSDLISWHCEEC